TSDSALTTVSVSASYDRTKVLENVNVTIPSGNITAIVGANGSGKSTLLKALARLMPISGEVTLFGESVGGMKRRHFARNVSLLGQGAVAPPGITVEELVATGRYPHQRWYRQWSRADQQRVDRALQVTECDALRDRSVDTLSGGQRQRAWLARALAQDTDILLLDEPTTFLDIAHQVDMLDLIRELNREEGRTIVIVVHDLCHACRYADHLIAVQGGTVVAGGSPREIMSEAFVHNVFTLDSRIVPDPVTHCPLVVPHGHATARTRSGQTRETEA
ncbi:MAG: ABC transporter ATP-binding protein, partial [Spirochaetales bacterium]